MKKLVLFLLLLFLGSGTIIAQQLSFRFANPQIIRQNGFDYLQFDIQVQGDATANATYLWASQINLAFNNTTFNTTTSANPNWLFLKAGSFNTFNSTFGGTTPKYSITQTVTGVAPNLVYNIALLGDVNVKGNGPNAGDFVAIPSTWTTMITVYARISDLTGNGLAGINFLSATMNGPQQYISAPGVFSNYLNPNIYDSRNFLTDYTGRFFSALGWSQIGGPTNNVQYQNWAAPVSTSVWEGAASIPAGSLSNANNLIIDNPATLTIPVTGQLTIAGNINALTPNGLIVQSTAAGTGSLISATSTGVANSAVVQRWMTSGSWHHVSSPLSGQLISGFLTSNPNVATSSTLIGSRGMMDYNPTTNTWNNFFTNATTGNLGAGNGFSLRLQGVALPANDGAVTFNGLLQAGNQTVPTLAGLWNCIGNPFSSAIGIVTGSTSIDKFLAINTNVTPALSNIDPNYGAIYVWNKADASNGNTGNYTVINNTSPPYTDLQQGQAFFVKMNTTATSISFTSAMQIHSNALALKSKKEPWPTINLVTSVGEQKSSTLIAFNNNMTKGLDPTFDAGLLKGSSDLVVYSKIVEGNGTSLAIQALPDNESNLVIPIGLDFKTGGEVIFSSELLDLPANSKVILEDMQTKTFTDLSKENYKAVIEANSIVSNRFFLHATIATAKQDTQQLKESLNAYAVGKTEIRIIGDVSKKAVATLYDVHGRMVIAKNLEEGNLNIIPLPDIKIGIYMLSVSDNGKQSGFKILIREQ